MAEKSKLVPTPIVYKVGEDITVEQYNELISKIGDWFSQIRKTTEPVALAKRTIDACLKGVRPSNGQLWDGAQTQSLAKRIRMACRFDMDTMQPIHSASEKQKRKKEREKTRLQKKREAARVDPLLPEEYRTAIQHNKTPKGVTQLPVGGDIVYGSDPLEFFTTKEREHREHLREGYLTQFPQLDNVAAHGKLDMLLDLMILQERLRLRNLNSDKKGDIAQVEKKIADITAQIVNIEKSLGIHPDQLAKLLKDREGGTIGEAIRRLESLPDYRQLREKAFAEELLAIFQMYHTPSPRSDMEGWQLDDVGLYGLTKTRLVTCPHCGHKNWAGLKIEEIEEWLVGKGYLKEVVEDA